MKQTFERLKERGYIYQMTDADRVKEIINSESPATFYLGIDPTADSLHIGHFFALMMFRHLQDAGHRGILLIGGATALVGDPSGKSDMRKMMSKEQVQRNVQEVKTLAGQFIQMQGDNKAIIVDNADWIGPYNFIDFMREVGVHFNVNRMLAAESYAKRLEEGGLTFLEMSYMLMQSYDFVHLNRTYGCVLQIGGSDQWGNIVSGTALSRKMSHLQEEERPETVGLTCPLLMTKEGKKMGKTEQGTLWVAREKTSVFDFYQYFYNVPDEDTEMLLRLFTHMELAEIEKIIQGDILAAKRKMAYEVTKLVHGQAQADNVLETVRQLFEKKETSADMPAFLIPLQAVSPMIDICELCAQTGFTPTKSETRRLIRQGGLSINGQPIHEEKYQVSQEAFTGEGLVLKKGKKSFLRVSLQETQTGE